MSKLLPFSEQSRWVLECPKCGEYGERKPAYNPPSQFSEFGAGVDCLGYPCSLCGHAFFTQCKDAKPEPQPVTADVNEDGG